MAEVPAVSAKPGKFQELGEPVDVEREMIEVLEVVLMAEVLAKLEKPEKPALSAKLLVSVTLEASVFAEPEMLAFARIPRCWESDEVARAEMLGELEVFAEPEDTKRLFFLRAEVLVEQEKLAEASFGPRCSLYSFLGCPSPSHLMARYFSALHDSQQQKY